MSLSIKHPRDPKQLILAWQQPDVLPDRRRWSVGTLTRKDNDALFRYFSPEELANHNSGRDYSALRASGFQGYPAFALEENPHEREFEPALVAFERRVPPRTRPDFAQYLQQFCIGPDTEISPLGLLGLTEARLPSDGFSLVDPFDPELLICETVIEIVGHHHYCPDARTNLNVGDSVGFVSEPDSPFDPNAIRIEASGRLIGYVNRLQAPTLGSWLKARHVSAWVSRLNGTSKQKAFAFLQLRPAENRQAA